MKITKSFTRLALLPELVLGLTLLIAATANAAEYVSVKKDEVNIRATPSTKGEISCEVFAGFPLQVLKREGQWAKVVDFEGDKGWIHTSMISKAKTVIVRKKDINLRQDPNADKENPVIATVKYGVVFTPLEKKGDWLRVRYDDKTEGWLSKSLVWPSDPLN